MSIKENFVPLKYTQSLYQRLQIGSFDECMEEFYQLMVKNDLMETKEQLAT